MFLLLLSPKGKDDGIMYIVETRANSNVTQLDATKNDLPVRPQVINSYTKMTYGYFFIYLSHTFGRFHFWYNPKHLSSKPITIFGVKKNENMSLKYQKCVQDQKCKK